MEIKDMTIADIEERLAQIETELTSDSADVEALSTEVDDLQTRRAAIKQEAQEKRDLMDKVATMNAPVIEERKEDKPMENMEIRNTKAYIEAYAEGIKREDFSECRALLTENVASGTVPVPEFVYDIVKTAWDREGIMRLVRKSYLRGNLKVGFEISGDDAIVHTEGGAAISPENLVLGVVEMTPKSIKKVVQISDEVYDLRGEDFLRYIYDELTYRIAKKAADSLIAAIEACGTVSTATQVGVPVITSTTITLGLVASAMAQLSDEAANPVIMMNKATWGAFKAAQAAASYNYDPFEGLPVVFNNSITAFSAATTGVTYAIVGDLGQGALANFPDGDGIDFKFDDLSLKKQDLIEVMGRQYVAVAPVAPKAFVKIKH